ncbi:hypothetical protein [Pedobacter aquatilis]|uniref:hypothetical protein n=1 Tax=Pedobacter aquatilis TaxID=351343 RepID=UPI00292D80D1|nr:hypothetical protein [Pedobacter aquatilis]
MIKIILIGVFCFLTFFCRAQFVATNNQYGCRDVNRGGNGNAAPGGNAQRIYYQNTGTNFSGKPTFQSQAAPYSEWNIDQLTPANKCFTFVVTAAGGCYVRRGTSPSFTHTWGDYGYWTDTINCPIDDYVSFLVIGCGLVVFFFIKELFF